MLCAVIGNGFARIVFGIHVCAGFDQLGNKFFRVPLFHIADMHQWGDAIVVLDIEVSTALCEELNGRK